MRDPLGETAGRIFAFRDISAERVVEQMRSDFVSTVSHELRAPLTSIYGFAATLLREDVQFDEEERQTFLAYIESEAARLTTIVDKLLSVARLDAGDLQLEIEPVDVRSLVSEVAAGARDEFVGGHELVVDLPEAPLAVRTDAEKLRQVLASLLDNAVRFSPGGGRVTIGAARRGETIVLSVVDQGIGIPDAEQDRIFSKFYRVGDAQTGGTGVGLFIAQGLVSALGGRISVRSAEGRGSSFVVELPARDASERGAGRRRQTWPSACLIVDDEEPIRLLCRVNLEAEGMTVLEAADGPSGLEAVRRERPDVVLLDVMMPGLDGWRVAEELLDDPDTRAVPIIFLTARAELRDRARGLDLGGLDYVTKPFNPVELASLIRERDRPRRGRRAARSCAARSSTSCAPSSKSASARTARARSRRGRRARRRAATRRASRRARRRRRGRRRPARPSPRCRRASR